ncbi:MAG: ATP-binding protein [Oligoflexales bacterium]
MEIHPPKILVVDDKLPNIRAMQAILDPLNAEVLTARSGNQGLALMLEHEFAVVLLDVQMPEMSGFEMARLIREDEKTKNTPLIFVTAAIGNDDIQLEAYSVGAIDFTYKPLNPIIIASKVGFFLELYVQKKQLISALEKAKKSNELERLNKELSSSIERFRTIFEGSHDGIIIFDISGRIFDLNSTAAELFNSSKKMLLNTPITELQDDTSKSIMHQIRNGLKTKNGLSFETDFLSKTKNKFTGEFTISHIEIEEKQFLLGVIRDVTERLNMQQQLLQSQKMEAMGQFSGSIAHDFNNKLAAIMLSAESAISVIGKDHQAIKKLERVISAGRSGKKLVDRLLNFSRFHAASSESLELKSTLDKCIDMMIPLLTDTVKLKYEEIRDDIYIKIDPILFDQIIMNLLTNARDAMPEGGEICISSTLNTLTKNQLGDFPKEPASFVQISVTDNGHGMNEETIKHIFNPFYTTKGVGKGTGLGLSTVNGIVRECGGHISVQSTVGAGTTFEIYLESDSSS